MSVVHRPTTAALPAALLMAPAPTTVHAADHPSTNLQVYVWAATCTNYHHTDTAPSAKLLAQTLPPFAGHSQVELIGIMQAFHSGTRPSTVMGQVACGYNGTQVATTVGWLSRQPQEAPWANDCARVDVYFHVRSE